jgi:tRNA (guanine37-N1)-methyltransferase
MGARLLIFAIISIFPELIASLNSYGVLAKAAQKDLYSIKTFNPREFTSDNYRRIDDKTFGGGAGMVMKIEPLELAVAAATSNLLKCGVVKPLVVYMSPQGQRLSQQLINQLALSPGLIVVCGRYEGVDERFIERNVDLELSLGDFVVSGGELPAMLLIDALIRQLPGALNSRASALNDSFMDSLLDYPHYTHPRDYQGIKVPEVLLSGNHEQIRLWRLRQRLKRTYMRRPELLRKLKLNQEQSRLLQEIIAVELKDK